MAEPFFVSIEELRSALSRALTAAEERFGSELALQDDYYWHLQVDDAFDMSREPESLTVYLLEPADIELDVRERRGERLEPACFAPDQVAPQVRLGMDSRLALEPRQVRRSCQPQDSRRGDNYTGDGRARMRVLHPSLPEARPIPSTPTGPSP
jgi:hypothetical protein